MNKIANTINKDSVGSQYSGDVGSGSSLICNADLCESLILPIVCTCGQRSADEFDRAHHHDVIITSYHKMM